MEIRCNGEDIVLQLDDAGFINFGYTIDTTSGNTKHEVVFFSGDEVDEDFMEFYLDLEVYEGGADERPDC